jgi:hypothetical protein
MQAIEILKSEHQAIRRLMTEVACSAEPDRKAFFLAFKRELDLHDAVETSVFYPAISANPTTCGMAGMDMEARRVVAKAMKSLESMPAGAKDWVPYFRAIKAILFRHMEDEEFGALDSVGAALSATELAALGARMAHERQRLTAWNLAAIA